MVSNGVHCIYLPRFEGCRHKIKSIGYLDYKKIDIDMQFFPQKGEMGSFRGKDASEGKNFILKFIVLN